MTAQDLIIVLQTVPGDTEIKVALAGCNTPDLPYIDKADWCGKEEIRLVV